MSIKNEPHYRLHCKELARWLEQQGNDFMWRVDGDPLLMSLILFPCPSSELAGLLKKGDQYLLIRDKNRQAQGQEITADQLTDLLYQKETWGLRAFVLEWDGAPEPAREWLLIEYRETYESKKSKSAAAAAG